MVKNDTQLQIVIGPAVVNSTVRNVSKLFYTEDAKRVYHLISCLYPGIEAASYNIDGILYAIKIIK